MPKICIKNAHTYAGVGSRKTPADILLAMQDVAYSLALLGWTLRSGGAIGADKAFEAGCNEAKGSKEIFYADDATPEAFEIAAKTHPMWHQLSPFARKLHARNSFQILGKKLDSPSCFVLCWTPDGSNGTTIPTTLQSGGTGQAIRLASKYYIPVINMFFVIGRYS
jgi:hypothetical protein